MLDTERAVPKPPSRYVASAAIEIAKSGIGIQVLFVSGSRRILRFGCNCAELGGLLRKVAFIAVARPLVTFEGPRHGFVVHRRWRTGHV